jgi:hypothetical protein
MEKLENGVVIATWSQSSIMKEREKRDPCSSYFLERASTTKFYFPFL